MRRQKGITLIALIITIIVMLILVGVTINVALNGGLFIVTNDASSDTEKQAIYEQILGIIDIKENATIAIQETYSNIKETFGEDKITLTNPKEEENIENKIVFTVEGERGTYKYKITGTEITIIEGNLPDGWEVAEEKPLEWDNEKITAITDGENIIPLPEGYKISEKAEEQTVAGGLVIKDSKQNEFVWIPVKDTYANDGWVRFYGAYVQEPEILWYKYKEMELDSQETLNYFYGDNHYEFWRDLNCGSWGNPYYKSNENYKLEETHYYEMTMSVNKYDGFYIGRYETTIDENGEIGCKPNTKVLTSDAVLKDGVSEKSGEPYYYRWWGLYIEQRNADVTGNNDYMQTNMISASQWNTMASLIDPSNSLTRVTKNEQGIQNSGQATCKESGENDILYNIYDLRINSSTWCASMFGTSMRLLLGSNGYINMSSSTIGRNESL